MKTYLFLLLLLVSGYSGNIFAQSSSGPLNGGTFSSISYTGSTNSWSNPSNALSIDGSYASAGPVASGTATEYIQVTNFGFSIPAGVTITGVEVQMTKFTTNGAKTKDRYVKIVKGGAIGGISNTNRALSSSWNSAQHNNPVSYGGSSDTWGETWTPADVNSSNFGVVFAAEKNGGGGGDPTITLDNIQLIVHYSSTLPIELTSFTAAQSGKKVELKWETASESNNDYFTIERTTNGLSFEKVALLKGAGNSNTPKSYVAYDEKPVEGNAYYRLKQTDYDGKFETFDLVAAYFNATAGKECEVKVFPNPCPGNCNVNITGCDQTEVKIAVVDAMGNIVYSRVPVNPSEGTFSFETANNLTPGIYTIMALAGDKTFGEKMIITNSVSFWIMVLFAILLPGLIVIARRIRSGKNC